MRCVVKFSDGSHINTAADRMEVCGNLLYVWQEGRLQAIADTGAIIEAHMSERGGQENA